MNSHQISLVEAKTAAPGRLLHKHPMADVDRATSQHHARVNRRYADGFRKSDGAAEAGDEFGDGLYLGHEDDATFRHLIRQEDTYRDSCKDAAMKATPNKRLIKARLEAGYDTAKAAADAFGWKAVTLQAHESGRRGLKHDTAQRYARAFRVSAAWLMTGEGLASGPSQQSSKPTQPRAEGTSPAMSEAAQAAMLAVLLSYGIDGDEARLAVQIVLEAASEDPIPGVDRSVQAHVSTVSKLRGSNGQNR